MQQEEMDPVMEVALWQHRQQVRGRIEARCTDVLNETKPKQKKKEKKQMHVEKPTAPISLLSDSESSDDSEATWDYDHSDNEMIADKIKWLDGLQKNNNHAMRRANAKPQRNTPPCPWQ